MASPDELPPAADADASAPFIETRYSLPVLLREVNRDRASAAFAMEKLDQPTISLLFERQRLRRDAHPNQ